MSDKAHTAIECPSQICVQALCGNCEGLTIIIATTSDYRNPYLDQCIKGGNSSRNEAVARCQARPNIRNHVCIWWVEAAKAG